MEVVSGESKSDDTDAMVLTRSQSAERDEQAARQQQMTDPDDGSQPQVIGGEEYSSPRSFDDSLLENILNIAKTPWFTRRAVLLDMENNFASFR